MAIQIQLRRDTATQWTALNPTLAQGELAVETDTRKFKIGDGVTAWSSLTYFTQGTQGPQGEKGDTGDTGPAGPQGLVWHGAWSDAHAYVAHDGVSVDGHSYVCILANTNKPPASEPTYWDLLADKGADGTNGTDGAVWYTGSGAPSGGLGVVGDFYLDYTNNVYYEKTGTSTWTQRGTLGQDHGSLGGLADDDHPQYIKHSLAETISDFLVASGAGAFIKKTLAEVKTILGLGSAAYTASTDYAVAAKGVTGGDSHDHVGGDGAQIDHGGLAGLSDADHVAGSVGFTATDKLLGRATTGAGAGEEIACGAAGRALLDDADADTQRATLGIQGVNFFTTTDETPTFPDSIRLQFSGGGLTQAPVGSVLTIGLDPEHSHTLDVDPGTGNSWGIRLTTTAGGETLAAKDVVYLKASDSKWWKAKADAAATSGPVPVAIVVTGGTVGQSIVLLIQGVMEVTGWGLTVGAQYFISAGTAGLITLTPPGTATNIIRALGFAMTATALHFNPSTDFAEKS